MSRRLVVVLALGVVIATSTGISFAYEDGCQKAKGHHQNWEDKIEAKAHMILMNKDELELTDEQVERVKTLKLKVKKDLIKQNAEIEIIALDIKEKMWDEVVDTEAINTLIDKKYELKKEKVKSLVASYAELKSILTKKQMGELKELYKKCKIDKKESHR